MFSDKLKQLEGQYLVRTREELALLRAQVPASLQNDLAALQEMQRLAHRINGSGAMLGFKLISEAAAQVERILRRADPVPSELEWQNITLHLQHIDDELLRLRPTPSNE
ncbi:MAG: Hpt domain-containing protein [Steroidobacteraceae bacterium]